MEETTRKELCAKAMGELLLREWDRIMPDGLLERAEQNALALIEEIRGILDDESLSDRECFYRIDAIVTAFYNAGLSTTRHWQAE